MSDNKAIINNYHLSDFHLDLLSILFLAILTILFMWRVVFLGQVLLPLDEIYTSEPWRSESLLKPTGPVWNPSMTDAIWQFFPAGVYDKEARQSGLPFWDANELAGTPALARGEMFSNPVYNLLIAFLPVARAISWTAVIHLFIGSLFTFLFSRELGMKQTGALVSSLAFTFNLYLIGWLSLPPVTGTMIWLPMIFWGTERAIRKQDWRWTLAGAAGFAIQILSGQILWPFYAAITVGLIAIYRSALAWLREKKLKIAIQPLFYSGLALFFGVSLVAAQILITIELYLKTQRTGQLGAQSFLSLIYHLPRLFAPNINGSPINGGLYWGPFNYPETTLYFGILPLIFLAASLFSEKRRLAWGFAGIGLVTLLAVYNIFPFRQIITFVFPVFLNTFPGRIFYVTAFTWAIAAGLGADWVINQHPSRFLKRLSLGTAVLAGFTLMLSLLIWYSGSLTRVSTLSPYLSKLPKFDLTSLVISFIWLATGALLIWLCGRGKLKKELFSGLVVVLLAADLFLAGSNINPTFDADLAFPETPSIRFLKGLKANSTEPFRIINVNSNSILTGMSPEVYGFSTVSGYSSYVLRRYSDYADLTHDRGKASINHIYFNDCCSRLLDALNVEYVYTSPEITPSGSGIMKLLDSLSSAKVHASRSGKVQISEWTINGQTNPVLIEHPSAQVSYSLSIGRPVTVKTAIALDPAAWDKGGDGVLFKIIVTQNDINDETLLFSRYIDPKHNPSDRDWIPVEVDLSRFLGKQITLSLVTEPGPKGNLINDWAGWADPILRNYYPVTLDLIYDGPNKIYKNNAALPRAWVVHHITSVAPEDTEAVKKFLNAADFDPAVEAVVEAGSNVTIPEALTGGANPDDYVKVVSYAPQRVVIEANQKNSGLLILSDVMYPGWKAYLDGAEVPIYTANLIMRSLFLEGGKHQIIFLYTSSLFTWGLWVTGMVLIVLAIGLIYSAKRSKLHKIS